MSRLFARFRLGLGLALPLWGCKAAVGAPVTALAPVNSPCYVATDGAPLRDTITVALSGPIGSGGSGLPLSPAERFLAAHLSADSSFLDCTGRVTAVAPGSYRLASSEPPMLSPVSSRRAPTILIQVVAPGADPRDLIDRGADIVITSDPATLEYAASRGDLRLVPLAWSTTYLLLLPPAAPMPVEPSSALRTELARDAVRAEARPAEQLSWWNESERCISTRPQAAVLTEGIAFPEQDPTARALAERLVVLSGAGGPRRVIAYAPTALDSALASGRATGFVVAVPRFSPPACGGLPPTPRGSRTILLIDVRATAVLRPGVPPFSVTGDGLIRFVPARVP